MNRPLFHHRIKLLVCLSLALSINPSSSFSTTIRQHDALIVTTANQLYDFVMLPSHPLLPKENRQSHYPRGMQVNEES